MSRSPIGAELLMPTFSWIVFATLYLVALFVLGLATPREGHRWLFGIVFSILWIVGALIGPTPRATARFRPLARL